jgi:hypothetical protein
MRTTLRIDDDLMRELKRRAQAEDLSLTQLINRLLRVAVETPGGRRSRRPYRQRTVSMGTPAVDLNKALALAGDLEDEETLRKLALRK